MSKTDITEYNDDKICIRRQACRGRGRKRKEGSGQNGKRQESKNRDKNGEKSGEVLGEND